MRHGDAPPPQLTSLTDVACLILHTGRHHSTIGFVGTGIFDCDSTHPDHAREITADTLYDMLVAEGVWVTVLPTVTQQMRTALLKRIPALLRESTQTMLKILAVVCQEAPTCEKLIRLYRRTLAVCVVFVLCLGDHTRHVHTLAQYVYWCVCVCFWLLFQLIVS